MDAEKKKRLAKIGWLSTSIQDFLGLAHEALDDLRVADEMRHRFERR